MTIRLRSLWHSLRSSLWFVPTVMTVGAIGAWFALVAVDHAYGDQVYRRLGVVYSGGAEGARAVLSAIATSMIAVAGVTFSITIVALTLASQQYGPRLLGNFLRDFGNQGFMPQLSVTFGVVLTIASLGILAVACLDQLGAGLMRLLGRTIPSPYRRDDDGRLRPVAHLIDAVQAIARACDPIRLAARGDLLATVHLLVTLEAIAPCARRPEDRAAVERRAALVEQGAREAFSEEEDRATVATASRAVRAALARGPRAA